MNKKVVIIHCWEGYPEYCWYPNVKKDLVQKGFKVEVPVFPDTNNPKLTKWLKKLDEIIIEPNEELLLVGHSVGCITIMRYLELLKEGQKIGGVVFVAPFTDDLNYSELANFFNEPINFEKIKTHSNKFISIFSDDDPYVDHLKYQDDFKNKLGSEIIIKHKMGHFSGDIDNEQSCTELSDVEDAIIKLAY